MNDPSRALVVGAGIGGLTAAIALERIGWDVHVLERAPRLEAIQVGAGLHLWSNALRALQHLGLADEVSAAGTTMRAQRYLTWEGRQLGWLDVDAWSQRVSAPTVGISRPEFHRILVDAIGPDRIHFGAELTGYEQGRRGVRARLADGSEDPADILVGADGTHSVVRRQLHGPAEPVYSGYTAWRAICDFSHPEVPVGEMRIYWGPAARILAYHVSGGRVYWLAMAKAPAGGHDPDGGRKAAVRDRYRGWLPHIEQMLEATDESAIMRLDVVDRDPLPRWGDGRVTLLGDAAHPMTPNLAQGACQAIEDGVALANMLRHTPDPVAALRRYEDRRVKRANGMVKTSRMVGRMSLMNAAAVRSVRDNLVLRTIYTLYGRGMARKDLVPLL